MSDKLSEALGLDNDRLDQIRSMIIKYFALEDRRPSDIIEYVMKITPNEIERMVVIYDFGLFVGSEIGNFKRKMKKDLMDLTEEDFKRLTEEDEE